MRKYRIENYGIYKNIFDVQMNTWWCGWITIKTFGNYIEPCTENYINK